MRRMPISSGSKRILVPITIVVGLTFAVMLAVKRHNNPDFALEGVGFVMLLTAAVLVSIRCSK